LKKETITDAIFLLYAAVIAVAALYKWGEFVAEKIIRAAGG
jgi:hypothetical protein